MIFKKNKNIQALLNEQKGFLFEYIVAEQLSRKFSICNSNFLTSLNTNLLKRLENYQRAVFNQDRILYKKLPVLADKTASYIYAQLHDFDAVKVEVGSRSKNFLSEDIVLENNESLKKFLSIKLCKDNSFINTRSPGIKSFFSSYFENSEDIQKKLNEKVVTLHERLRLKLLDSSDLDLTSENFSAWIGEGNSSLPGELSLDFRQDLHQYYNESIHIIYEFLIDLFKKDNNSTEKSLLELCGLKKHMNESRIIYFCLHKGTASYDLARVIDLDMKKLDTNIIQIIAPTRDNAYFLVEYPKMTLQIRVKPMRDFTTPAMKVNCSIKFKKSFHE